MIVKRFEFSVNETSRHPLSKQQKVVFMVNNELKGVHTLIQLQLGTAGHLLFAFLSLISD